MASFQAKIGWKRMRKRENKNTITFRSYPKRNVKFQEKSKKIQKKSKYNIMPLFQAKIGWKMLRKREYKNYRSVPFLHDEQ